MSHPRRSLLTRLSFAVPAFLIVGGTLQTADAQSENSVRRPVAFVRRLTLIDNATNGPISDLRDGMTIRLADVPEGRLNIVAETYPRRVDSVSFKLVEQSLSKSDASLPFTLLSNAGSNAAWQPKPGPLTMIVQPIQNGSPGIPLRMRVTFIGDKRLAVKPPPEIKPPAESRARLSPPPSEEAPPPIDSPATQLQEPTAPPETVDRCRAVLRPESGQLTVVCSHSLTDAKDAQLMLRAQDGDDEGAVVSNEPLCEFENALSPIVTSCVYLDEQLERLQVRIRTATGRERIIPVGID